MTTTNKQEPKPDTRYAKQEVPQGDFAAGERTKPPVPEIDDFASGEHTQPVSTSAGDFASGEHTQPIVPENPSLVDTLPSVPVAIDHKE